MRDIVDKNWPELSQQVADLQVRALLKVIYQIGEVLDKLPLPAFASRSTV
jgi:hypothetical protein